MVRKLLSLNKEQVILALILVLAFVLRVYRLPERVWFDFDQEYAANFAKQVITYYPIQLIGQGISIQGLFMGPWYFYFLVPFFWLTHLHPIGGYFGSVFLGLVIIASYYFVLSRMFSPKVGLVAALIRAFWVAKIGNDLYMAPAFSSELAVIFTLWCLYKLYFGDEKCLLPLGFIFGLYASFHPILFPFGLVFIFLMIIRRKVPDWRYVLGGIGLLILALSPLILFEFLHKFLEIKLLFSLSGTGAAETKSLATLMNYGSLIFNFSRGLISVPPILVWLVILVAVVKLKGFHLWLLFLTVVVFLGYYFFLPTHVIDYYFLGVEVVLFVYFVVALAKNPLLLAVGVSLVLIFQSQLLKRDLDNSRFSLRDKDAVVARVARLQPDNRMNLLIDSDVGWGYGFKYLEWYYSVNNVSGPDRPTYTVWVPKTRTKDGLIFSSGDIGLSASR